MGGGGRGCWRWRRGARLHLLSDFLSSPFRGARQKRTTAVVRQDQSWNFTYTIRNDEHFSEYLPRHLVMMFPNLFFFERQYSKSTTAAAPGSSFPSGVWNPTANPFDATSKQPKLQSTHIERERPSSENLHLIFPSFHDYFV